MIVVELVSYIRCGDMPGGTVAGGVAGCGCGGCAPAGGASAGSAVAGVGPTGCGAGCDAIVCRSASSSCAIVEIRTLVSSVFSRSTRTLSPML